MKISAATERQVVTLYGIKNCDTVKKARKWLEQHSIEYQFHDFREDGLSTQQVQEWLQELGWETLVNKRSTTWKQLPAETQQKMDHRLAQESILAHPTLIKRPLLDTGRVRFVGFSDKNYQNLFAQHTL